MTASPRLRIAAALLTRPDGHMLVVRKRGTFLFEEVAWIDPAAPGARPLAALTRDRVLPLFVALLAGRSHA